MTSEGQFTLSNSSLLWGPYRPNLYLGIRPRIPQSLLIGLMWSNADDASEVPKSMHQQDSNRIVLATNFDQTIRSPSYM